MAKANDRRGSSKFERFARSYGVELLAARLMVRPSAVYHWLRGATSPHPANAIMIQNLAKERQITLSLDEIYQHFREAHAERYSSSRLTPLPAHLAADAISNSRLR
jgi:hypothetical protein